MSDKKIERSDYLVFTNVRTYLDAIGYNHTSALTSVNEVMKQMQFFKFIIINATIRKGVIDKTNPSGRLVVVIMSELMTKSSDFQQKIYSQLKGKFKLLLIVANKNNTSVSAASPHTEHKYISAKIKAVIERGKHPYRVLLYQTFIRDVRKHRLVSKHTVCTDKERDHILKTEHLSMDHIPHILYNDPQVIWINGAIGDLIRIDKHKPGGLSIGYRVVIS